MIKLYTAFTEEIDDPKAAAEEILEQLNPKENMLKNTIGIVHFHCDFAEDDIWREFAAAMPFEIAGCMSTYIGTGGGRYGDAAISVTMLTGDDVSFAVKTIDDINSKSCEQLGAEVKRVCGELCSPEKPKMIMPLLTPTQHFSGDNLVDAVNAIPEPPPLFGMLAFNIDDLPGTNLVLGNGKMSASMYAFLAVYGSVEPKFHVSTSLTFDESLWEHAVVSDAENNVLKSVNGIPALQYLKKHGLVSEDNVTTSTISVWAVPAILTLPNGAKVARAFLGIIDGTEHVHAAGVVKNGSKIVFSHIDGDKTIESAAGLIKEISAAKGNDVIIFSCAARAWSLGAKFLAEIEAIASGMKEHEQANGIRANYCTAYTGGEICPVRDSEGKLINTLHNYTLIACVFN